MAEEVVQDCFELAWRHMDQLRDRSLARPWLFSILRREALRNIAPATKASFEPYDEACDERTAGDGVGQIEQRMDILAALQALPAIHREALTLFYFEDMPVAEMALALDVAPGTVLSRLNRAREALRLRMQAAPAAAGPEHSALVVEFPHAVAHGGRGD